MNDAGLVVGRRSVCMEGGGGGKASHYPASIHKLNECFKTELQKVGKDKLHKLCLIVAACAYCSFFPLWGHRKECYCGNRQADKHGPS